MYKVTKLARLTLWFVVLINILTPIIYWLMTPITFMEAVVTNSVNILIITIALSAIIIIGKLK